MPVAVPGDRQTLLPHALPQQDQVPLGVLLLTEEGVHQFACRVIDCPDERQAGTAALQPVMLATVHLQHHPLLEHPFPTAAVSPWAPPARVARARWATE